MKRISEKTTDIDTEAEDASGSKNQDAAITAIIAELAKVITHLTAAAESTWAAMNFLESIPHKASDKQGDKIMKTQSYLSWACCVTVAVLACVAVFNSHIIPGIRSAPQLPDAFLDMQNVCGMMNKHLHVAAQVQNATLAEFDQRFRMIEKALASNDERIDNVWEALGPPNAQGTYFARNTFSEEGTIPDGQGSNLHDMKERMGKVEADALELKRKFQRAEVRMTSRINKLERKEGLGRSEME
ncbi:uncharacterized protein N0V89_003086 [Didymosphaeria variabile]|uniref:Uncharacterized protein n=1 Tax=Didymosphaeria variabile TaxID=1932322 RepID=A0A9W8XW16_9PLEO|nr:uncharacterized protein N0V89_003086 [Didymosphaeria variabile]KAJ4358502.1 hypothetical protein N0V89_003086 [Didymosphaeria variabile]